MIGMGLSNLNSSPMGATASPAYVRFETRAIKRMAPVEQGGAVFFVDVDYALVTPHGSKDVVEKALPDWFEQLKYEVHQERYPMQWLEAHRASYRAWKEGQEIPVIGTPLKNWPLLTPAEAKNLNDIGLRAIEDLAAANEETVQRIGMGARSLIQRARDWLQTSKDTAPLVTELDGYRNKVAGLELQLAELRQAFAGMSRVVAATPEPMVQLAPIEDRYLEHKASVREEEDELIGDGIATVLEE